MSADEGGGGGGNATPSKEETERLTSKNQDADLEDLLSPEQEQQQQVVTIQSNKASPDLVSTVNAYCSYACHVYPRLCFCLVVAGIAFSMIFLCNWVLNPTERFGEIEHDYSGISTAQDLNSGDIHHWCIQGDNDSCRCEDPLEPQPRSEYKSWTNAHMLNKRNVQTALEKEMIHVAFLGESLVEEMDGRWMGRNAPSLQNVGKTFRKHFEKSDVQGVALGVAGDAAPNVLWRLLHGEAPEEFNPKIWWLSLGMNDLGRMQCSEEVVVMGILNVVEHLKVLKPDAKIVINSMLPMAEIRGGVFPLKQDFQDAFQNKKNKIPRSQFARPVATREGNSKIQKEGVDKNNNNDRFLRKNKKQDDDENKISKREKKQFQKKIKRDAVNPKMKQDQTTMKRYDPKKLFLKQNRLPLWTSISAINRELRSFASKHESVTFFDATSIFAEAIDGSQYMLMSERISVRGHPTEEGYQLWEDKVKEKIDAMLKKMEREDGANNRNM